MKKYVCPMGCLPVGKAGIEPQDQPGNCPECGMKLLPADERGLQRGSTRMMDDADKRGLSNTQIHADNKYQRESACENNISVDLRNKYPRESALLQLAASLNQFSQHFIAQAILEKAKEEKIEILKVEDFENLPGKGVKGKINNKIYYLVGENLLKGFNLTRQKLKLSAQPYI